MAIVAMLDMGAPVPLQVSWAAWFARAYGQALVVLVTDGEGSERAVLQARTQLVQDEAFDCTDSDADDAPEDDPEATPERLGGRVVAVPAGDVDAVVAELQKAAAETFVVLLAQVDSKEPRVVELGRELLPRVSCTVAVVDLGDQRWPLRHLMVAASRGAHPRQALRLARDLCQASAGQQPADDDASEPVRLTAAYVEPDIGSDAQSVGSHVLGRVLKGAFDGSEQLEVARRVVVAANVDSGLAKAAEVVEPDAIVMGMPRPGLLSSRFFGGVPARVCRKVEVPVVMLRPGLPLGNRVRRGLEQLLQRIVPQVERDTRVELAARVQSSSAWNFDFVALISLSTVIAALGLLQNSAAVIIGAMLIAPLMTPILGVGLALAQGNVMLMKLAFKTIAYGVSTSLLLAAGVGWIDQAAAGELVASSEMLGRGWPGLIDLFVAFVSGLAAAYANSRPSLVAALPGVAIAAALVPPIATSGLALSAGDLRLAYGSFLLFFTNMVAIVLAAGVSLWAVGVRKQTERAWLRHVGNAFLLLVVVLAVHLSQRTRVEVADRARAAAREALPAGLRIVEVKVRNAGGGYTVRLELGGREPPAPAVGRALQQRLRSALDAPVELRLAYVWQDVLPADGR